MESNQKQLYEAPEMIPIEVSTERMICISGTRGDYGAANEEEWD